MTIQVALQALGEATKLLASRTAANRLTMFHGTASGPNNSRLRSILKHGLIPTAPKAWADDPDARQAGRRSRASYGGTYFTVNPRIALSSVYKARGDDKSQYPVIITATIQPRAALPDEDDYTFGVDHAYHYAVKTVDHPHTDGYYYLCLFLDGFNNGDLEEARKRFADNIAGMLKERGVSLELPRLRRFTDPLFDAEVVRRVSNQSDDWYGFKKTVQGRALDYFKYDKQTPLEIDQLPEEIRQQPTHEEGEVKFRAALDALTKATRRLAIGLETHSKDAPERFGHVLRVMEPVTFRGRNRITSIVSLPNYYSRGTGTPVTVVSHYGDPTAIVKHLESTGYEVEVISPGARPVSAAAYTDESGKFWGAQGAGAVFLAEDTGRILIQHRSPYVNEPNTWGVIGGAIDAQEDPQAAMEREVHEETGYNGQMRVEKLYVFQSGKFRYTNFLVTVPHEFSPHHGWESQGHVWTTLDDLPEPLHFGFKAVLPSLQQRLGQEAVSAATTPLPELSSKEPGLMTVGEFIASRNPKATYHTNDAYDFDLKKLNRDFSLIDKGTATAGSVKYNVAANNKGFLIYEDKVLVAVIHDGVLYKGKSAKTLPSGYIDYRNREYTDFGVTATKTVKYPAEYVRLVSDVAKNNLATYKVLLRSALVSGEPMQVRAKEQPEKNKGVSLAVINERGEIVAEATDEWGATLLVVAQEYRGKNLGQLIGKFWYMLNPDWESGGFTKGGEENATRIWEDRVREFLANGWYSELVRQGTLTKQRVEEITAGLRPRKQKKEEPKVEDKKGEVLVYVDDPKEPVSFVIYDSQFLEDQDDKYILAHGFFRSSESVGSFLYKLDYERPYAKLATYVALQMARANGEPIYIGEGYGDLLELEGLENVTVDGDYASLTKDVLPLATIAAQERRARKPFDQYQQVYHSLLEQADSKW